MREKLFSVGNYIYLLFLVTILSAPLKILDFRLGSIQIFSLINIAIDILFFMSIFVYFTKNNYTVFGKIRKIQLTGSILIYYLLIIVIISISRNNNSVMSILAIKNLIFPILVLISGTFISNKINKINFSIFVGIINFFQVINILMVLVGLKYGWQVVTQYILGKSLYAYPIYQFGVSSNMVRVPGLFTDALTQGAFSYLVFIVNLIIFINNKYIKRKYSLLFIIIGIIGIVLSTNRQVILATIIFLTVLFSKKYKKLAVSLLSLIFPVIIALFFKISNSKLDIFSLNSLNIRTSIWKNVVENMDLSKEPMNFFFGTGVNATVLGKESSNLSLVDNSYLLILHDYGVIGLSLFILVMISILVCLNKYSSKSSIIKISLGYCIFFIVRMFFHSSIVNVYDSYMFCLITLIGLSKVSELKDINKGSLL